MHPEAITSEQKRVGEKIPVPPDFYLVGGTALALQIGHRLSVDFDFFTERKLPENLLSQIEKAFPENNITIVLHTSRQLTLRIGNVEVTYFLYPFKHIFPLLPYKRFRLLSIPEIASSKAHALGRRATFKDYVDLYFIMKEGHVSLSDITDLAQRKYGETFDPRMFFEQLLYLDDVPKMDISFLKKAVTPEELTQYFKKEIQKISL